MIFPTNIRDIDGTELGQNEVWQSELGQTELGQTETDQTELGQSELGQSELGQIEFGQTEKRPDCSVESSTQFECSIENSDRSKCSIENSDQSESSTFQNSTFLTHSIIKITLKLFPSIIFQHYIVCFKSFQNMYTESLTWTSYCVHKAK